MQGMPVNKLQNRIKLISFYIFNFFLLITSCQVSAQYTIPRTVQYSFTLTNRTNQLLEKNEFYTYAPVRQTATQECKAIECSLPYELITDAYGNQILHFTIENLAPYAIKIITVKAELMLSETPVKYAEKNKDPYIKPEKYIESESPVIIKLASKLKKDNELKTAENIYSWVAGNIKYAGYIREPGGALSALNKRYGDCTEYMALFTALCRADKIKSRNMGGYYCTGNSILKPYNYHNWAEFMHKGTWFVADPQKKRFLNLPRNYIAMQIIADSPENPLGKWTRYKLTGKGVTAVMDK